MYHTVLKNTQFASYKENSLVLRESHPAKMDLNKKSGPKPRSVQTMLFDAQGFRKAMN